MLINTLVRSCVNVIFPSACQSCGKRPAAYPLPICMRCADSILGSSPPPVHALPCIPKIWSCRPYEGPVRECITKFKYCGKKELMRVFDPLISDFVSQNHFPADAVDLVIPVPLHPSRRNFRGYNQSELISNAISGCIPSPSSLHALVKTRDTAPQTGLTREKRIKNLKNSFAVIDRPRVSGRAVMLVDDIVTTGATLDTCARALLKAGARVVYAFTLARTL